MDWKTRLKADPLPWLLEGNDPAARYVTMRDLQDIPADDAEIMLPRRKAHSEGRIAEILDHMHPDGFWEKPGGGYGPKYRSGVWSLIFLAQLGADIRADQRLETACRYYVDHAFSSTGGISYNGAPGGTIDCLQGNMLTALLDLGYDDPRLDKAFEWMARTVTGEGLASKENKKEELRYYAYQCGPDFRCGANNGLPCAWGAVKVMLAFSRLPRSRRTPLIERAIARGIDFLLNTDPATAEYPVGDGKPPSQNWWKFGFPVFYITDVLQICEALTRLGCGGDKRLANAIDLVVRKQNDSGQWLTEYDYKGKTWVSSGRKKTPDKWVTIRALRVLKAI